jgi:hypothetical protein
LIKVLTVFELSNINISKALEGGRGEVNRGTVLTGRAGIGDDNVDGLALPGNSNLLTTVLGLGTGVTVGTVV